MSMDMIIGKEKNIIISREKKTRFICFLFPKPRKKKRNLFLLKLSDLLHMLKIFPRDR
jgi:hypothetical protein